MVCTNYYKISFKIYATLDVIQDYSIITESQITLIWIKFYETLRPFKKKSQAVSHPVFMTLFSQLLGLPTVPLKTEGNIQMKEILEIENLD